MDGKYNYKCHIFSRNFKLTKNIPNLMIKFGVLKERKTPPDHRVVFSPNGLSATIQSFPNASFKVEPSTVRTFDDEEYDKIGAEVSDDLTDCDVLIGVKEVPISALLPEKKYFFFSHTIKKQPYNRQLLRAILDLSLIHI